MTSDPQTGHRLDEALVARGFFDSRSRARDAILRGSVTVAGAKVEKPGKLVPATVEIVVDDPARAYVSRAALKLIAGLDHFHVDPSGAVTLDLGASTGGFTQVLLERGAARVFAVDVGHGQMRPEIAADSRVTLLEGVNARDLDAGHLGREQPSFLCSDVSFISLRLALPPALSLMAAGARAILLFKPQFEVGRERVGRGGLVEEAVGHAAADDFTAWLDGQPGWSVAGLVPSPIAGGDGNHEYLVGAVKT